MSNGFDPRLTASRLLGPIAWQSEVSGYCRCPGESMHTSRNSKKDCRVNIDGAPTVYCFHAYCAPAAADALCYLVATKPRTVTQRKLRGL